jgi:hypothetical protein
MYRLAPRSAMPARADARRPSAGVDPRGLSQSRYRPRDDRRKALIGLGSRGDGGGESTEKSASRQAAAVDHLATMWPHILGFGARRPQYVDAEGDKRPEGSQG